MLKRSLSLASLLLLAAGAFAAGPQQQYYKYKDKDGHLVIERSIPPEYVAKGYQIVTLTGQIIQDVPAAVQVDPAIAQRKSEDAAKNARLDIQLRKLYSSPMDAVRLRDRQLESIKLKLEFARGQALQLKGKRKLELDNAARQERAGRKVPAQVSASIASLDGRIAEQEAQIKVYEAEQQKLREEFVTTIMRLNVIYPDKALPAEAAAPVPAPAPK